MTSLAIRKSLMEYIRFADEKKINAIYTIVEEEIKDKHAIWTNEFVNEMQNRSKEMDKKKGNDWATVQNKAKTILSKK